MRGGFCMFHQINGMIRFARDWEAQWEIIREYVREFVQQLEDVRVVGCVRVLDRFGNRLAMDDAILGEVHQAFNLGPVMRGGFHESCHIHIRGGKETRITRGKDGEAGGYVRGMEVGKEKGCSGWAISTGNEIGAKDMGCVSFMNQIFATSPQNVRLKAVEERHAQDKGHTSGEDNKSHTR